jgi:O-antigen biosynthesis protein
MGSLFNQYDLIKESGLFDEAYYRSTNPEVGERNLDPVVHYLEIGARELRNPSAKFNARKYAKSCEANGERIDNPLLHYIEQSRNGGSKPAVGAKPPAGDGILFHALQVNLERINQVVAEGVTRLIGAGWCLADSPLVQLSIHHGSTAARVRYGSQRADVGREYPLVLKSDHSGFEFELDLAPGLKSRTVDLVFSAQTALGTLPARTLTIDIQSQRQTAQNSDASAVHASPRFPRLPMQLQVDTAAVDGTGILRVMGWAVCMVPVVGVDVFVDDLKLGTAEYGKARADVAAMHSDYPNAGSSGFLLVVDANNLPAGERIIRIQALASTGISREVQFPVRFPDLPNLPTKTEGAVGFLECFCDVLEVTTDGRINLKGWAVGSAATESIVVVLDDVEVGEAQIGQDRPDVGNRFPKLPHARRAGFSFTIHAGSVVSGEHLIVLRHRSSSEERDLFLPVAATEASTLASPRADLAGVLLHVDRPEVIDGNATSSVRGNLEIAGWALARSALVAVEIAVDGQTVKRADTGVHRRDVERAYPEWRGADTAGFSALLPKRSLPVGCHTITVTARAPAGESTSRDFRIEVEDVSDDPGPWSLRRYMNPAEVAFRSAVFANHEATPQFAAVLLITSESADLRSSLHTTLASLAGQVYQRWRLWIVRGNASERTECAGVLEGFEDLSDRIELVEQGGGDWLQRIKGTATYVCTLRPGDELGCDFFLEFAALAAVDREAQFIYADDRRTNSLTAKTEAFFKPGWSPDLLLSMNYIGRAWCAQVQLLVSARLKESDLVLLCDYDLVLRLTEVAQSVRHLPAALTQNHAAIPDLQAERNAIARALQRRGIAARVTNGKTANSHRAQREIKSGGLVSIIIPTCAARGLIKTCIESLRAVTAYRNFEVICIENIPDERSKWRDWLRANADKVIETTQTFNWSRFNNIAAASASGEFLLFLNDDIEIIESDWLEALLEHGQRADVGAVGARLLYPDGRIQHAGMFLARLGTARHAFRYAGAEDPGYFGLALTQRNVISVTGACLLTRRETFESFKGFDEAHDVINNDLDYCLRVWQRGLLTVYTPYATLIHHELASRADVGDDYDAARFDAKWRETFVSGDPFFSPHFAKDRDDYSPEWEPVEWIFAGNPIFSRDAIRRILVVKLDHIGDCVISLPAVRKLKRHFPRASLSVLTSRASRAVWDDEPMVDHVIEFDLFHAKSGLGLVERTEEDFQGLFLRLKEKRFDLAVDLRRHGESRSVLRYTGARYLAGFDARGRFPWLHVALEAAEDSALLHKRHHTADDLTSLVDAVGSAGEPAEHSFATRPVIERGRLPDVLNARRIFRKSVVCVHPAVGTEMRQWPVEYFALLIDQLIEAENVHVILIGAPGEAEVGKQIISNVTNRKSVWSLIGRVKLNDLPQLLTKCALFVGNNSGPQHIAAGLAVPTVGIHSGVVDAREWGPRGMSAVALQRSMACSPCYLSKPTDCVRGLACLRGLSPSDVAAVCHRLLAGLAAQAGAPQVRSSAKQTRIAR